MPRKKDPKIKTAKLTINENTYELPIYKSTEGESVIDILNFTTSKVIHL